MSNAFQEIADQYEARVAAAEAATLAAEQERDEALRRAEQAEAASAVVSGDARVLQEKLTESNAETDRVSQELGSALQLIEDGRTSRQRDLAEIERLRARNHELEAEINEIADRASADALKAKEERESAGLQYVANMQKESAEHAEHLETLRETFTARVNEVTRERDAAQLALQAEKAEVGRLNEIVRSRESTLGSLAKEADELYDQRGQWTTHIARLESERDEMTEQRDAAIGRADAQLTRIQELTDELHAEKERSYARIAALETERDQALARVVAAEVAAKRARERADQVEADARRSRGDSAERIMEAEKALARAQTVTAEREAQIERLTKDMRDLEAAKPTETLAAVQAEADERVRVLQAEADQAKDEAKRALADAERRAAVAEQAVAEREEALERLRADLQAAQGTRMAIAAEAHAEVENTLKDLHARLADSETDRRGLEKRAGDLVGHAKDLEAKLELVARERDEALAGHENARQELAEAFTREATLTADRDELRLRVDALVKDAEKEKVKAPDAAELDRLRAELTTANAKSAALTRTADRLTGELALAQEAGEDLRRTLDAERASLTEAEKRVRDERERADRTTELLAAAQRQLEAAQTALADEKDQHQRTKNALADKIKV